MITRRVWLQEVPGYPWWSHARTVIRVHTTSEDKTSHAVTQEDRYAISNVPVRASSKATPQERRGTHDVLRIGLAASQWLRLIRLHWGVENNCHCLWDKLMHEDHKPWLFEPKGMLSMQVLRRVASVFLAVYRATHSPGAAHVLSWPALMELFLHMVWTLARVPKSPRKPSRLDSS